MSIRQVIARTTEHCTRQYNFAQHTNQVRDGCDVDEVVHDEIVESSRSGDDDLDARRHHIDLLASTPTAINTHAAHENRDNWYRRVFEQ